MVGIGSSVGTGNVLGTGHGCGRPVRVGTGSGSGTGSDDLVGNGFGTGCGGLVGDSDGVVDGFGATPSVRVNPGPDGVADGAGVGGSEAGPGRIPVAANATPPRLSPASASPATFTHPNRRPGASGGDGSSRERWNAATVRSSPANSSKRGGAAAAESTEATGSGVTEPRPDSSSAASAREIRRRLIPLISYR